MMSHVSQKEVVVVDYTKRPKNRRLNEKDIVDGVVTTKILNKDG